MNTKSSTPTAPQIKASAETTVDILLRRMVEFAPLLLALTLALWTFWLINTVRDSKKEKTDAPITEPDYYMHDFEVRSYSEKGTLNTKIAGSYGEHIPNPDTLNIKNISAYSQNQTGSSTRGTAMRGVSKEKDKLIELFGKVYIEHQAETKPNKPKPEVAIFQSEYLKVTDGMQNFSTNKPVKITQGKNTMQAQGMQFSNKKKILSAQGRVKATIAPDTKK